MPTIGWNVIRCCLIRRARNVLAQVPAGMQAEVKDAYWALFGTEDLKTQPGPRLAGLAGHRITEMAGRYAATYPAAMKCLLADRGGLTAYLRFPAGHHHRIRHPDFTGRTFGEARRRTKVIGRLPRRDLLPHPGLGRPGSGIPWLARPDHDRRRAAAAAGPAPLAARTAPPAPAAHRNHPGRRAHRQRQRHRLTSLSTRTAPVPFTRRGPGRRA
jgi:hypothetical protein